MNLIKGLYGFAKKEIIWLLRAKDRNFEIKPDNHSNSDIVVQDFHKNLSPKQWQNIDPSSGTVRVYEDLGPIEASWPVHSPKFEVPKIKVYVWVSMKNILLELQSSSSSTKKQRMKEPSTRIKRRQRTPLLSQIFLVQKSLVS